MKQLGARTVLLRLAVPAANVDAEQMGLAAPGFQEIALSPALVKQTDAQRAKDEMTLQISATAVRAAVGTLEFAAATGLFAQACGVVLDGVLMRIVDAGQSEMFGEPYVYRLTVAKG
ncbi:hypothetical protein [Terriglobus tenax]|uniref:hypothetical protein n=1 Tax=Terriglobus tenax TaxID=1111115 RepID=UPI0021E06891|nr:hypothetical protein [Terriglobus tenax]